MLRSFATKNIPAIVEEWCSNVELISFSMICCSCIWIGDWQPIFCPWLHVLHPAHASHLNTVWWDSSVPRVQALIRSCLHFSLLFIVSSWVQLCVSLISFDMPGCFVTIWSVGFVVVSCFTVSSVVCVVFMGSNLGRQVHENPPFCVSLFCPEPCSFC